MPRLLRLITARLSCLVTARYINAAAGLSSHGAVVVLSSRYVHTAVALSSYGAVVFVFTKLLDSCLEHNLAAMC